MLGDFDKVNVTEGSWGKKSVCNIKACKSKAKFMVFNDDGATKLSRLFFCSCGKHLPIAIRRAWKENNERMKKKEANEKRKSKKDAKILLGIK